MMNKFQFNLKNFLTAVAGDSVIYRETIGSIPDDGFVDYVYFSNNATYSTSDEIAGDIIGYKKVEKVGQVAWRRL